MIYLFDIIYLIGMFYLFGMIYLFSNVWYVLQGVPKKRSLRHCSTHYGSIFKNLYIFEIFVTFLIDRNQ